MKNIELINIMMNYLIITKKSVYNLWKSLNPTINPKRGKYLTPVNKLILGQKVVVDKQEISNSMNEHFCYIGNNCNLEFRIMGYLPQRINNYRIQGLFATTNKQLFLFTA